MRTGWVSDRALVRLQKGTVERSCARGISYSSSTNTPSTLKVAALFLAGAATTRSPPARQVFERMFILSAFLTTTVQHGDQIQWVGIRTVFL